MNAPAKTFLKVVVGMAVASFIGACASTGSETSEAAKYPQNGFLHGYYEKLQPGKTENDPKLLWIKSGVERNKYKRVMVDYVIFAFAQNSEYKGIDANEMKTMADGATLALVQAIQKQVPVAVEPGPDVLRIRMAIVDLQQSKPVLSTVTTVIPAGLGLSLIKKGATGTWTGAGGTTAEMMILDSMTNEVLAAGVDQRQAGFGERFTKWGSFEEAFAFWGERMATRISNFIKKK
jgi:hypothetical protein